MKELKIRLSSEEVEELLEKSKYAKELQEYDLHGFSTESDADSMDVLVCELVEKVEKSE
ncbi:hypothetical protein KY346_00680 [Candidatus Woesearchaeota archaeon]|nr:hypothetical protein [Candidatus Woesearchaeota archaeon]